MVDSETLRSLRGLAPSVNGVVAGTMRDAADQIDSLMRVVYELLRNPEDKPPFDEAHDAFEMVMGRGWDDDLDRRD